MKAAAVKGLLESGIIDDAGSSLGGAEWVAGKVLTALADAVACIESMSDETSTEYEHFEQLLRDAAR